MADPPDDLVLYRALVRESYCYRLGGRPVTSDDWRWMSDYKRRQVRWEANPKWVGRLQELEKEHTASFVERLPL